MTTSDEGLPWLFIKSDSVTGEIELRRHQNSAPPQFGNIRPLSLAGSRAVHQRRQDLLRILEDDSYLLRAWTDLPSIRTSEPYQELMDGDFLDKELEPIRSGSSTGSWVNHRYFWCRAHQALGRPLLLQKSCARF